MMPIVGKTSLGAYSVGSQDLWISGSMDAMSYTDPERLPEHGVPHAPAVSSWLPERLGMFVRIACKPGARPGMLDALHTYVDGLTEESGTESFIIGIDPDEPDVIWLYEWFTDEHALVAHRDSAGFAQLMGVMGNFVEETPGMMRINPIRTHLKRSILEGDLTMEQ